MWRHVGVHEWIIEPHGEHAPFAGVTFRVGELDEPFQGLGTNLIASWLVRIAARAERSAVSNEDDVDAALTGFFPGSLHTSFLFEGTETGIVAALDRLVKGIGGRLEPFFEDAKDRARISASESRALQQRFGFRWGPEGPGRSALPRFGLETVTFDQAAEFLSRYYTSQNAVFWTNSELIPMVLGSSLPQGPLVPPPPAPSPAPGPQLLSGESADHLVLTTLFGAAEEGRIAGGLLGRRTAQRLMEFQAIATSLAMQFVEVSSTQQLGVLEVSTAPGREGDALRAMAETLDDMADSGVSQDECSRQFEFLRSQADEKFALTLERMARDALIFGARRGSAFASIVSPSLSGEVTRQLEAARDTALFETTCTDSDQLPYPWRPEHQSPGRMRGQKFADLINRSALYRLDGTVLGVISRTWTGAAWREKVAGSMDLTSVRLRLERSDNTTVLVDEHLRSFALSWTRIGKAEKLKARVLAEISDAEIIPVITTGNDSQLAESVRKSKRGMHIVYAVLVVCAAAFFGAISAGVSQGEFPRNSAAKETTTTSVPAPQSLVTSATIGEVVRLPNGTTLQVLSLNPNATPAPYPSGGYDLVAAVDIQVCGGSAVRDPKDFAGVNRVRNMISSADYELVMADNSSSQPVITDDVRPALSATELGQDECRRGKLGFERMSSKPIGYFTYHNEAGDRIRWQLPSE